MAVTGASAVQGVPAVTDYQFRTGSASGVINVGDWLAYSGQGVLATNAGDKAYWRASGAGIAMQANPIYDQAGRSISNTALLYATMGIFRVTGAASGAITLGNGVYPVSTGSAVGAPTGLTGVGATWQTGVKLAISGVGSAGSGVGGSGVATIVGLGNLSNAGTGEWDILLMPPRPDYF